MTFQLWKREMKSDYKCLVKTFFCGMLTLEFQWHQWEEVIAINRKMGIESRVRDIVFQGIAQGQTIFWLRVNKGMIL